VVRYAAVGIRFDASRRTLAGYLLCAQPTPVELGHLYSLLDGQP